MTMACFSFFSFFFFFFSSNLSPAAAAVFKVGDSVGWSIGKIDYASWASKKTFHVGDMLLFEYSNGFHNVVEVKKAGYDSCSTKSPIKKYATGNDSIAITSEGDHHYLCGFPGHCQAGQKLKIAALAKGSSAAPSAAPSMAPSAPGQSGASSGSAGGGTAASPPNANDAAASRGGLGLGVVVAVAVGFMVMLN